MKLYLIRHGQVHNPEAVLYGRLPGFGLSNEGKKQAIELGLQLRDKSITSLYTSPLLRARQTAAIISDILRVSPQMSRLLTESGQLPEGKPLSYFKQIEPDLYAGRYVKRGQESIEEILVRMQRFVARIGKKHADSTVAAVSHGDPILILKSWYDKQPFTYEYKVANMVPVGGFVQLYI